MVTDESCHLRAWAVLCRRQLDEEEGEKGTLCAVAYDEANKMSTSLQADMPDFFGKDVSKRVEKEMHRYRGATLPNQLGSRIVQVSRGGGRYKLARGLESP